ERRGHHGHVVTLGTELEITAVLPRVHIPPLHRAVCAAGNDLFASLVEGNGYDARPAGTEHEGRAAARGVAHRDKTGSAAPGQPLAVRGDRGGVHPRPLG